MRPFPNGRPAIRLGYIISALLLLAATALIFIGMVHYEPDYLDFFYESANENWLLYVFNIVPILLTLIFCYGLTGHAPFSAIVTATVFLSAGAINHFKLLFRSEPFVYADFGQAKEGLDILKVFDSSLYTYLIAGGGALVVVTALFLFFIRGDKLRWWVRLLIVTVTAAAFALFYAGPLTDEELHDEFPISGSEFNQQNTYSSRGWIYEFIFDSVNQRLIKPAGYSNDEFAKAEANAADAAAYADAVKPHVVMIMSEAFCDLSDNEAFDFKGLRDPLKYYKEIAADAVVSGHIAVDTFGGGTAKTEFEALSAVDTDAVNLVATPYSVIRNKFPCLPNYFRDLGYDITAIHPGDGWFYNRQNVYPYFGFEDFYYINNGFSPDTEMKGPCISEVATFDKIREVMAPFLSEEEATPSFTFCVTIQNHGGYDTKYGEIEPTFNTDLPLSDRNAGLINQYFHGVIDCDEALNDFITELDQCDEPVVVVYWGDHYPSLESVYEATDYGFNFTGEAFDARNSYFTPFFIWQNSAAAKTTPISENAEKHGVATTDAVFDTAYLGSTLMQLLGLEEMSPFMAYANTLRDTVPVSGFYGYADTEGHISADVPPAFKEAMEKYKRWCYYKITQK